MKFRDALLAGPEHGADRLPVEADRRLRRRLDLDATPSPRRVWLRPALATFAVAAVALVIIYFRSPQPTEPAPRVAVGFVDVSKARWSGTVTTTEIDVRADSPASATVAWADAAVIAAPGTRLTTTSASALSLTHGAIQIQRTDAMPMFVDVPLGRVVIAAYRSSVSTDRESVTILINDGTGHYIDANGQPHPLVPNAPLVWPPPADGQRDRADEAPAEPGTAPRSAAPVPVQSPQPEPEPEPEPGPEPGPPVLVPSVPRRPDVPCTFKSDCDPGATCRKNESGASVCMGNGSEGAACWFDSDCLTQRCVQRRCASNP